MDLNFNAGRKSQSSELAEREQLSYVTVREYAVRFAAQADCTVQFVTGSIRTVEMGEWSELAATRGI